MAEQRCQQPSIKVGLQVPLGGCHVDMSMNFHWLELVTCLPLAAREAGRYSLYFPFRLPCALGLIYFCGNENWVQEVMEALGPAAVGNLIKGNGRLNHRTVRVK